MNPQNWARLQRPHYPMPQDVQQALEERKLMEAYRERPPYQQNDYVGWIQRAKRPETRRKRLEQMLDELERGGVYMKMNWNSGKEKHMASVADLVDRAALEELAIPYNLRLGGELAASGAVELLEFGPLKVKAKVTGGQTRTVELNSTPEGLKWRCTCSKDPELFCKHAVAVALVTWEKSPRRS